MGTFVAFRDGIRRFILAREIGMLRLWNAIIALAGLLCINNNFGYQKTLSQVWVSVIIAIVCALLPLKGISIVLAVVLLVNLLSLDLLTAAVALVLWILGYLICAYFHSKNTYNMITVPICYSLNCPYVIALGGGLLRNINEAVSVVYGSILAYYLHVVKINASTILDETSDVSVLMLMKEQMLQDKLFYFFEISMLAMFFIVYFLRSAKIRVSWLIGTAAGVLVEFIIMLAGFLSVGQKNMIPGLIVANIVVLIVGFILNYFILDLDYSRIEKVQFEDDDYYYYVTAVPKIRIVQEDKEIKTF